MTQPLRADHAVAFSYRRSVGGRLHEFLAGLAGGRLLGARTARGTVVVPPVEHDPETGEPTTGLVEVGPGGAVRSWTWVDAPGPHHPLDRPFAFALVQLDGADTSLLHVVDVGSADAMHSGMRVHADWRDERAGTIRDIRAFVPQPADAATPVAPPESVDVEANPRLAYAYEPGLVLSGFLRGLGEHRIDAGRCPSCGRVYVPPRVGCPLCGGTPMTPAEVGDAGVVETFTVVHVPFHGMTSELPFAWARIRLDGADVTFPHLLGDVDVEDVRVGMRVRAVWVAGDALAPTWESIRHFAPDGA